MKTIDLDKILDQFLRSEINFDLAGKTEIFKPLILLAMKEACRQAIELASKNAELYYDEDEGQSTCLNKQSILDTFNQITIHEK